MASNSEGGTRKLAAIMFTDVKDFSKKMSENEVAAMEVLKIHDDAMREIVARNNGVVVKSLGDSFMVDFSSAVNAVHCAIEAQEHFHKHSLDKPEFEKIQIRIGIHLGDVMNIGTDLYGDGVNIAARIETITEANRICVSSEIYNQVKNKLPIRAYAMGSIDLKNIAEPVEVYELLLDSIPGLSEPSESAKSHPTRRKADLVAAQEQEEANRVETAKQKIDEEQERENAEKTARANEHYAKAKEYLSAGDLTKAEEEIKEIYKIVQIHYEAQMLTLQVEEQRAVRDEEERRRRVKEEKQRKQEERKQQIQKCLDVALGYVEQEQYQDALNALQEVYTLEPNNEQAKRIEKQVQFAEEARLERQRLEALAEEERGKEEALKAERERAEEFAKATIEKVTAARKEQQKIPKTKMYIGIGAIVVLLVAAAVTFLVTRTSLRKPGTVAILPFSTNQADDSYLGEALSVFVADEVARAQAFTVLDPVSSHSFGANTSALQTQASALGITHFVRGALSVSGTSVSLRAQLFEIGEEKALWETTVRGNIPDLNALAAQTSAALLKFMDIEAATRTPSRPTENSEAFNLYLRGLASSTNPTGNAIQQSITLLQDAVHRDSTLTPAKLILAKELLEAYQQQGKLDETILASAFALAQEASKSDPNSPTVHAVLGQAFRYKGQFDRAGREIAAGLAQQPGNAQCNRELALLSLIQGNTDEALKYAETAMKSDPQHFRSYEAKGIIQLYKEQFEDASRLFDQATALGGPDSLLTVNYKFRIWISLDQEDKVVLRCQQMMDRADERTKALLHYWMGRAFSLKGKLVESSTNFDQGVQLADQVVSKDPKDYISLATYALLEARRAKTPKRAVALAEEAVKADSTSARVHYWKARVYAIQKNTPDALRELTKAISIQYSFPEILDPDFLSVWQDPGFKTAIIRKN
jgi:class 3 adenylate cyclase/Tfp pilus assembly protein PilF/TolB-like protein